MIRDRLKYSKMKRLKLVLFDVDHTLISNGGAGRKALYQALQECLQVNIETLEAAHIRLAGKTDLQNVREFIVACGHEYTDAIANKILDLYLQCLPTFVNRALNTDKCFMHEGVAELLATLEHDEKIALGLLTGNLEKGAYIKLEPFNLMRFFPIGAYGCDSASRLDLPAIAHKRAQEYYQANFTPADIVIIGDAENDVLCAKHYGAISLAVNTGTTSWEELSKQEPDYLFSSLKETDQVLKAIMAGPKARRVLNPI
jgi:phosphoglycolate phosphatase